jgi:hypothetical protein
MLENTDSTDFCVYPGNFHFEGARLIHESSNATICHPDTGSADASQGVYSRPGPSHPR